MTLPLRIRWDVYDWQITGPDGEHSEKAGYFAVFVDRPPMPPGEDLTSLAEEDRVCVKDPDCPDADWFRRRFIFPTSQTELVLDALPPPVVRTRDPERHEITVVLLSGQSRRVGEASSAVTVFFER